MGFGGLGIATSGLRAAQVNLAVTGHNMANAEIAGFSRQRIVQSTGFTRQAGISQSHHPHIIGMGTDWQAVHQIRNEFLDFHYRQNVSRLQFYSTIVQAGMVVEGALGELYGAYNFQSVVNNLWYSIQELTINPAGLETRQLLLANINSFLNKAQSVYTTLFEYQQNLDLQIREMVNGPNGINATVSQINHLNLQIRTIEVAGDNANDFRDERNRALDRLAQMIPIDVRICQLGDVNITSLGHNILTQGHQNMMGLRFVSDQFNFVEPVFTHQPGILSSGTSPEEFQSFMNYGRGVSDLQGNDFGELKALMLARGNSPAHAGSAETPRPDRADPRYAAYPTTEEGDRSYHADVHNWYAYMWGINHAMIPEVMMNLDRIVMSVATMLNDAVTGNLRNPDGSPAFADRPLGLDGRYGLPIFIRNTDDPLGDDWTAGAFTNPPSDIRNFGTLLSINNLRVNPALLESGGHNRLAFSLTGAESDTDLLNELQRIWMTDQHPYYSIRIGTRTFNVQDAYINLTGDLSTRISDANSQLGAVTVLTIQADNKRNAVKGVAMDEELNHMLRFQHAFNASSRVFNVIDEMIDQIVNGTGRVGR